MKKLLISGASGLLGFHLTKYFADKYGVVGTQHSLDVTSDSFKVEKVDLTDFSQTKNLIDRYHPDFIIHTVALTSVDECETNPEAAHLINVETTLNLVKSIAGSNTKFLYISTDHLFSGKESNYTEDFPVNPINIYAKTKLAGEKAALTHPNSIILRTNFYGGHTQKKSSFSSWIYNELKANKTISMFTDSYFTPISIIALTENIELLLKSDLTGIYNIVGEERLTKYEFGLRLAQIFHLPKELIKPSSIYDLRLKAKRPKDMSLSIDKIKKDLPSYVSENVTVGLERIKHNDLI